MNKRNFIIILILFFFHGIFTNFHHPLMPSYVNNLNLPNYMFGFFFAFMNLGMLFGAPFWGSVADSGKKRLALVLGYFLYGMFQLTFGLGSTFGPWSLSLIRFLSGFGISASYAILPSEVVLLSDKRKRAKNIAISTALLAIGAAIGQFLGGQLYTNDFFIKYFKTDQMVYVLLIQAMFSAIASLYVLIFYKPLKITSNNKKHSFLAGFKEVRKLSIDLILFFVALTFITIAAINVDKYLDIYLINVLGYKEDVLGQLKMVVGFVTVLSSILIVPIFMKLKKRLLVISIFQAISSVVVFIIFYNTRFNFLVLLYTVYMIYIIVKSINDPLEREYISNYSKDENMATIMGVRHSFYSLGTIVGPIFGAFLYDYKPKLVFYVSAGIFLIAILLILISFLLKRQKNKDNVITNL